MGDQFDQLKTFRPISYLDSIYYLIVYVIVCIKHILFFEFLKTNMKIKLIKVNNYLLYFTN